MNNSHTEILLSCKTELEELKARLQALQERISALEALSAAEQEEEVSAAEQPVEIQSAQTAPEEDFTSIEISIEEPAAIAAQPIDSEPSEEPVDVDLDLPEDPAPEPHPVAVPEPVAEQAPAPEPEDPTAHLPWRTDRPGIPVKNIRSGISLLDRAMFIGTLFKEDAALYDATLASLNQMESLDQAVAFLREQFPDWDLSSNTVYHFIMSVRKKLG